jgi:hypothetical protein
MTSLVHGAVDQARIRTFLTDGYLTVQPSSLDDGFHRRMYDNAGRLHAEAAALAASETTGSSSTVHLDVLGDNLRARLPEIDRLLADPAVHDTLTALAGPDHVIHPHSYCHVSSERDQLFHQDGNLPWNERGHYRTHEPEWLLLFYYPQMVDSTNGPTEIVAGSQYWTVDHERPDGTWFPGDRIDRRVDDRVMSGDDLDERDRCQRLALDRGLGVANPDRRFLHVPAGTVVIAHYDIVHRGSRVAGNPEPRYMFKFYATRVNHPQPVAPVSATDGDPVVAANLAWLTGQTPNLTSNLTQDPNPTPMIGPAPNRGGSADAVLLVEGSEDERVGAAYRLGASAGAGDPDALAALVDGLWNGSEGVRRACGHGLRRSREAGLDDLVSALASERAPVRRTAAAALGTHWASARPDVVAALLGLLASDVDDLVRSNAAYTLGHLARHVDEPAVVDGLLRSLEPGVELDNAHGAGFSRSTVRQSAAYGLLQVLVNHRLDRDRMARVIDGPMVDDDRYVQGLVVEGLARAPRLEPDHRRAVIAHLAARRWSRSVALT